MNCVVDRTLNGMEATVRFTEADIRSLPYANFRALIDELDKADQTGKLSDYLRALADLAKTIENIEECEGGCVATDN